MRTRSCENQDVNDIWLCDKGWFGYEFINHPERLKTPLIKRGATWSRPAGRKPLIVIASKLQESKTIAGFGGNPLTLEENYLFRQLVGTCGHRIGMPIFDDEGLSAGMETPIEECENLETIHFLGVDLTEEFPVIWLRLKQALNKGAKGYFYGHYAPEIAPHLKELVLHAPGEELEAITKY